MARCLFYAKTGHNRQERPQQVAHLGVHWRSSTLLNGVTVVIGFKKTRVAGEIPKDGATRPTGTIGNGQAAPGVRPRRDVPLVQDVLDGDSSLGLQRRLVR